MQRTGWVAFGLLALWACATASAQDTITVDGREYEVRPAMRQPVSFSYCRR